MIKRSMRIKISRDLYFRKSKLIKWLPLELKTV